MQQHPRQDAARALGQPAQKHAAGKGRQALRKVEMQHTEQQRRGKDGRRAAAGAHQALKRTAEQQFFRDGGHNAERQKLHEQLRPAAGQHFTGCRAACQAVDECARQIGKVRHAEKNRQAEAGAPRCGQHDPQVFGFQPRDL